jgi:hypothetical protein
MTPLTPSQKEQAAKALCCEYWVTLMTQVQLSNLKRFQEKLAKVNLAIQPISPNEKEN